MPISQDQIQSYFQKKQRPLKLRELAKALRVSQKDYTDFRNLVKQLARDGGLLKLRNRYTIPDQSNLATGRLSLTPEGYGFVALDTESRDIFIGTRNLRTGLHGDRVLVRVTRVATDGRNPEGELVRVLERSGQDIIGTYHSHENVGYVSPEDPRLPRTVYISQDEDIPADDGQKVIVHIETWPKGHQYPEGKILEVLGNPGDPGLETLIIIKKHDLPINFPAHVISAAEGIPDEIPDSEYSCRTDLRDLPCLTIDPENAKDHDDAVSIESLVDGTFRLGVHIADVSHFIRQGTSLDQEARVRGTSVYLVDRMIPMLPDRLSSHLCSLLPGEDRLAITVLARLQQNGTLIDYEIKPTIIRSHARFTYSEVQAIIENNADAGELTEPILQMEKLRRHLTQLRIQRGAIDFEVPEAFISVDKLGYPIHIEPRKRLNSHRLIEEFMLLANQVVADYMADRGVPILYRIHDRPDIGKLAEFARLASGFGYQLPKANRLEPTDLQELLDGLKAMRIGRILNSHLLRSMKKAVYSPKNIGHFGLACENYTHFTSPIRRYPDLLTHRFIRETWTGLPIQNQDSKLDNLSQIGDLATHREITAQEAERESISVKQIQFLEGRIGDRFTATITNVRPIGLFVELDESLIEGLIRIDSIEDDFYIFQEFGSLFTGERTGRVLQLGDAVDVELLHTNMNLRRIDFRLVQEGVKKRKRISHSNRGKFSPKRGRNSRRKVRRR